MACRHRDLQSGSRAISLSGPDKQILHPRGGPGNSTGIFPFARVRRIGVLATEMKSRFVLVTQWRRGGRDQFHEQSGCEQRRSDNQERHHARTESTRSATNGRWENRLSRGNDCPHSGVGVSGWDRNERRTSVETEARFACGSTARVGKVGDRRRQVSVSLHRARREKPASLRPLSAWKNCRARLALWSRPACATARSGSCKSPPAG